MLRKIAVSAAGAGALALLLGNPASATGNFHPVPIPASVTSWTATGAGPVSAVGANIVFQDVTAGISAACASGDATGTLHAAGGNHDPIADNLSITTTGCASTSPALSFNLTPNTAHGPWELYATDPTVGFSVSPPAGVTPGKITGVSVKGTVLGGLCTVQVDGPGGAGSQTGEIIGTYDNATGIIHASGASNIQVWSAGPFCLGAIKKGDIATLSGDFTIAAKPQIRVL